MRIQVLHLPGPENEWPFALVFDQCDPAVGGLDQWKADIGQLVPAEVGARHIFVFAGTVEVL